MQVRSQGTWRPVNTDTESDCPVCANIDNGHAHTEAWAAMANHIQPFIAGLI